MGYKLLWLACKEVKMLKSMIGVVIVCLWKEQGQGVRARCPVRHSITVIPAESGQVLQLLGRRFTLASYTDHLKASSDNCSGKD